MPIYTRADLEARVNAGIKNKIGLLTNRDETINDAVREVNTAIDLRSTRRKTTINPGIFDEVLAYPAPTDLKARRILSLSRQTDGNEVYFRYNLIPYEQFNQKLGFVGRSFGNVDQEIRFGNQRELYTVAFDDQSMIRRMLISAPQDGNNQTLSSLDSLTSGGGLWTSFGDAFNVDADSGNYVRGNGSIGFDIDGAGGTTAGIYNATLTPFSISGYLGEQNSIFLFAYFSDVEDITNITLRIGTDASNYYQMVVTATHFNTVFQTGWNVLRFDIPSMTIVGAPDADDCNYIAAFMTKDAAKINQNNFNFDHIVIASGSRMNLRYYSKYAWQNQAGVWMENSTEDDDFLNVESDEYSMIIDKAITKAGEEVDEREAAQAAELRYVQKLLQYQADNPSEAMVETVDYQAQYYI